MKQVIIDEEKLFNNYTPDEIDEIKVLIANTKKFLDKNKLAKAASVLNIPEAWQYPELCMILVSILTKLGNYKTALKAIKKMKLDKIEERDDYDTFKTFKEECIIGLQNKIDQLARLRSQNKDIEKLEETVEESESFDASVRIVNEFNEEQNNQNIDEDDTNDAIDDTTADQVNDENAESTNEPTDVSDNFAEPAEIDEINKNYYDEKLSETVTKIYADYITEEEIKNLEYDQFTLNILLAAFYEKSNKMRAANFVKQVKKSEINDENRKILNRLYERVINKKTIFNIELYLEILKTRINYELFQEITLKKQEQEKQRLEQLDKVQQNILNKASINNPIKKEVVKPIVEVKEKVVISEQIEEKVDEYIPQEKNSNEVENVKPKKVSKPQENVTIRKAFYDESFAVRTYLYILMQDFEIQREAVLAYDNFEIIIDKPVTDIEALKRFKKIILDLNNQCDLNVSFNEEKFQRYIGRK